MPKKGWKNIGVKEELVNQVKAHLKKKENGKLFPRSVQKFVMEAIGEQIEKEKS